MKNKDFKIGDNIYPAYDCKANRITKCKVVHITEDSIHVEGIFWRMNENQQPVIAIFKRDSETPKQWSSWVKYNSEPTLMEQLGVTDEDVEGDFYMLYTRATLEEWIDLGHLKRHHLPDLD